MKRGEGPTAKQWAKFAKGWIKRNTYKLPSTPLELEKLVARVASYVSEGAVSRDRIMWAHVIIKSVKTGKRKGPDSKGRVHLGVVEKGAGFKIACGTEADELVTFVPANITCYKCKKGDPMLTAYEKAQLFRTRAKNYVRRWTTPEQYSHELREKAAAELVDMMTEAFQMAVNDGRTEAPVEEKIVPILLDLFERGTRLAESHSGIEGSFARYVREQTNAALVSLVGKGH